MHVSRMRTTFHTSAPLPSSCHSSSMTVVGLSLFESYGVSRGTLHAHCKGVGGGG